DSVYAQILSLGERLSAQIMYTFMQAKNVEVELLDSREYIKTKGAFREGVPIIEEIEKRFSKFRNKSPQVLLMAGFVASNMENKLTLLGRNGSDYSAALMAAGLQSECCEIWTDVDGIYTADPRLIPDAKFTSEMSYGEAMELSFYGAKVLHPKTIAPLITRRIPMRICNSLKPSGAGTKIHHDIQANCAPVRGISCLDNIAMINIYGPGMKNIHSIAARIFTAISKHNIAIVLITQSSSEYSICFCVAEHEVSQAKAVLNEELALELKERLIENIDVLHHHAIISIVGEGMRARRGIAGKFFSAFASADINVVAISQGSSERSISTVINGSDSILAMNVVHRFFFKTVQPIEVFLLGPGAVGSQLLEQIRLRQNELLLQNVDIRVHGIMNSKRMVLSKEGINLDRWSEQFKSSSEANDFSAILKHVQREKLPNAVLVDCTSSEDVAESYLDAFNNRIHVVTANKKANTSNMSYYRELRNKANKHGRRFLYETNVGAGLPVIDTLQNLLKSGDQLLSFSGILSGSLSFIFGLLEEEVPFSKAIAIARDNRFTEPDPRDDLSGLDVARKLLILYRETGSQTELNGVEIEPLFPADFDASGSIQDFLQNLRVLDDYFANRVKQQKECGKVMRFMGQINNGKCQVGIKAVDKNHPLYAIKGGENAFAFLTKRYSPIPLVVRGYGAGTEVTAAGVFTDILRMVHWNVTGDSYEN
ncbi:MAG: bifunctional aspartate kinase/homoserine dehydrogenase I, partial [Gammaproteobacteria bacterium]